MNNETSKFDYEIEFDGHVWSFNNEGLYRDGLLFDSSIHIRQEDIVFIDRDYLFLVQKEDIFKINGCGIYILPAWEIRNDSQTGTEGSGLTASAKDGQAPVSVTTPVTVPCLYCDTPMDSGKCRIIGCAAYVPYEWSRADSQMGEVHRLVIERRDELYEENKKLKEELEAANQRVSELENEVEYWNKLWKRAALAALPPKESSLDKHELCPHCHHWIPREKSPSVDKDG